MAPGANPSMDSGMGSKGGGMNPNLRFTVGIPSKFRILGGRGVALPDRVPGSLKEIRVRGPHRYPLLENPGHESDGPVRPRDGAEEVEMARRATESPGGQLFPCRVQTP